MNPQTRSIVLAGVVTDAFRMQVMEEAHRHGVGVVLLPPHFEVPPESPSLTRLPVITRQVASNVTLTLEGPTLLSAYMTPAQERQMWRIKNLRPTAHERANPNQPFYAKFKRRRR